MSRRKPIAALRPFVKVLWATDPSQPDPYHATVRECVLPTGDMHLVFRRSASTLRIFRGAEDPIGYAPGDSIIGGARAGFYLKQVSAPDNSIGAQLHPGAGLLLFGVPVDLLAGRHAPLADFWGRDAVLAHEQIFSARTPTQRLNVLESILLGRLPRLRGLHPAVAGALERFRTSSDVRAVAAAAGYSHRHFNALFVRAVGLTPKLYCRVRRFRNVLASVASDTSKSLADLALATGYSDQSHFNREFREFSGFAPGDYRRIAPRFPHHVPLHPGQFRARRANGFAPD